MAGCLDRRIQKNRKTRFDDIGSMRFVCERETEETGETDCLD